MLRYLIFLGFATLLFACNEQTIRKQGFEVHGIDASHYQKEINWEKVVTEDIHFAFIKATEGESFKDSFYCKNWMEMKAAGIKRGAYHFFRPTISPKAQAINFIETAELGNGDFAPVLDVEVLDGVASDELRNNMEAWLQIVEDHYKVKPILYTSQKFFNQHLAGHFQDYPIWIARYSSWRKPNLCADQEWVFWQYGNRGKLSGVNGPVDFNVFSGNKNELNAHCLFRPEPLFNPPPISSTDLATTSP